MKFNRLLALLAAAILVVAVAAWLRRPAAPSRDADFGNPVLAGLAAHLDAVSGIRLVGAGGTTLVTLEKKPDHWQVVESDYRADDARVRRVLVALGDLRVLEQKTDDPTRYAALGVEDPAAANAKSVQVELTGLTAPTTLIVGRTAGTQGSYVRLAGSTRALEARPALDLGRTPHDWLARGIVDLAAARVASVDVARADGPAWRAERATRDAAHFSVPALPKGKELSNLGAADSSASAFGNLEFEAVRPAAPAAGSSKPHQAIVSCYDGLVVTLTAAPGTDHWIGVSARFDAALAARFASGAAKGAATAEQVTAEAARINAVTAGHEYQLAPYRFDGIFRPLSELLRH
jgi:Domain of unknown function (DUF4340)